MASSIASSLICIPPVSARTTDMSGQGFLIGFPPQQDVGYVTGHVYVSVILWNGLEHAVTVFSVSGDAGTEGIFWDLSAPKIFEAMQSLKVVIDVTIDGPLVFTGIITFGASTGDVTLTLTGTRAPHLSGNVGYLMFWHDWTGGFDETFEWKTDVLIAFDRTEQRVRLRTLPRRSWDYKFLAAGDMRRKLETWLGMRKVRHFCLPIWRDQVALIADIPEGGAIIAITEPTDNLVVGSPVAVWSGFDDIEIRNISGVGADYIAVDYGFETARSAGAAWMSPIRYCVPAEQRRVARFTEDVGDYRMVLTAPALYDYWQPDSDTPFESYQGIILCPFIPSWEGGEEGYDNQWMRLDNETGLIEFDIQSEEPVFSRDIRFMMIGRENINLFLLFLFTIAGRLTPFWVPAHDRAFELREDAASGDNHIIIKPIDYAYSLKDSPARTYIEMVTTGGAIVRIKITGTETLENGDEKLFLNTPLSTDLTNETLNRCAWLEKVRLDSDTITLHWIGWDCFEVTFPVVVLP